MKTGYLLVGALVCGFSAWALAGCGSEEAPKPAPLVGTGGAGDGTGGAVGPGGATGTGGGVGTGGSAGAATVEGVALEFTDDWVDGTTNTYGIQGSVYTFKDDCETTTITWDPLTRCATGQLTDPGAEWLCWGVGIGFDFNDQGEEGTPPNAINAWDATAAGVAGVSWILTGDLLPIPLSVWVVQADPAVHPDCLVEQCSREAPPDGLAAPPMVGSMTWDLMRKADWGEGYEDVAYVFDPTQIVGLEFALDAVPGGGEFSYCVQAIGILPAD